MTSTAKFAISVNLRRLMHVNDVDLKDLAKVVDRNVRTVRRWLNANDPVEPNLTQLAQLAGYLGTTAPDLMREVLDDWSKFGGGAFEAARIAMAKDRLLRPGTGILMDYLVLGVWVDEAVSRSFYNAMLTGRYGTERLYMDQGKIWSDGVKVGHVRKSGGNSWNDRVKFLFHFTGKWFKRPENGAEYGGAGYTDSDAYRFVMDVFGQMVSYAKTAVGEQKRAGENMTEHDTIAQMLNKIQSRISGLYTSDIDQAYALVSEVKDIVYQVMDIPEQIMGVQRMVDWSQLVNFQPGYFVVPRADYALEVEIDESISVLGIRDFPLPGAWQWRQSIVSEDGETVYAGTSKNPLKYRGDFPLLAAYRESDRPDVLRLEVRVPNVIHQNPKVNYGVRRASELAARIIGAVIPWSIDVDYHHESYNDDIDLSVPCLSFDPLPCVLDPQTGLVPNKPFTGHHVKELRRLTNQGFTCIEKFLSRAMVSYIFARTPLTELNANAPTPLNIQGLNLSIPAELVQAAYNPETVEQKLDVESLRRVVLSELVDVHVPDQERIEYLINLLVGARHLFYPEAGMMLPSEFNLPDEAVDALVLRLTEDPQVIEWPGGRSAALYVDERGYEDAHDYDPAECRLNMFEGLEFRPVQQPRGYHD